MYFVTHSFNVFWCDATCVPGAARIACIAAKEKLNCGCELIRVHAHVNCWTEEETATIQIEVLSAVKKFFM